MARSTLILGSERHFTALSNPSLMMLIMGFYVSEDDRSKLYGCTTSLFFFAITDYVETVRGN